MNTRENQEEKEIKTLSPFAAKSRETLGRKREEKKCPIRTDFQRDRDRITHSKAFRRLKYKTQVFISPEGDHYRTRLTHTLEVAQISRTIARALSLNEDLTEAIALGHDLGHTPFGHAGERALNEIAKDGFKHNEQSIRVVEKIEKNGKGLNLTQEVLDGILNHRSYTNPGTLEGKVVRLSDKIAYINHDIEDALRAGVIKYGELPGHLIEILGSTSSERINTMILDTIKNSDYDNDIKMSEEINAATRLLRKFMFDNVYASPGKKKDDVKIDTIIKALYDFYLHNEDKMTDEFIFMIQKNEPREKVVCDFIACMTDRFAINTFMEYFIPKAFTK